VLARAVELHPADDRVRAWCDEAKKRVRGVTPEKPQPVGDDEHTDPYRPLPARAFTPAPIEDDPFARAAAEGSADTAMTKPSPILNPADFQGGSGVSWPAVTPPIPSTVRRALGPPVSALEDDPPTDVDLSLTPGRPAGDTLPFPPDGPAAASPPPPPPLPSHRSVLDLSNRPASAVLYWPRDPPPRR